MSKRIESEKKYYCLNSEDVISELKALDFKLISSGKEKDEYFTDIKSEYIKTRTCLRIRSTDDNMQITFKGKSKDFSNSFCKLESNYNVSIDSYNDYINLFSNLGYYSYTIVNKNRYTYQKIKDKYSYSVMVDNIEDLGGFVEFEVICDSEEFNEEEIRDKLNKFVSLFKDLNLEEASLPYRDFVAIKLYNEYVPKKNIKGIHLNLDKFLKEYEKDFYNFYKKVAKEYTGKTPKLLAFRENIYNIDKIAHAKLDSYFDNIKIVDKNFIVLFELLKEIKKMNLEIILSTNCNQEFIENFILKVFKDNIIDNIVYLNNNKSKYSELKKHDINLNNYFNIALPNLKETVSLLLVIINNFGITK